MQVFHYHGLLSKTFKRGCMQGYTLTYVHLSVLSLQTIFSMAIVQVCDYKTLSSAKKSYSILNESEGKKEKRFHRFRQKLGQSEESLTDVLILFNNIHL